MINNKSIVFVLAIIMLASASCTKQDSIVNKSKQYISSSEECMINVDLDVAKTKVVSQIANNESTIQNVQIFVFRKTDGADDGVLDVSASAGFPLSANYPGAENIPISDMNHNSASFNAISLKSSAGKRDIYAVINDSEDRSSQVGGVSTLTEFLALTHELKNSASNKLFMINHEVVDLVPGNNNVSIAAKRRCASIVLTSIKNDFTSPAYQKSGSFRIEDIYILNVPGQINFGGTSIASTLSQDYWYNKGALDTDPSKRSLIHEEVAEGTGTILEYGSTNNTTHTFYSYPNDCAASTDAPWNSRAVVLVVEASIKYGSTWKKYYYPITIAPAAGIESNKQYKVDLTIHRPGSMDPNIPVKFADATPMITVSDWENGESYTPDI